jgi:hypothetical protein
MPALKKGLSGLEPYEGKLSRTVLRGGSGGNITLLPGAQALHSNFLSFFGSINVKYFAFFLGNIYLSIYLPIYYRVLLFNICSSRFMG